MTKAIEIPVITDFTALESPDELRETLRQVQVDVGRICGAKGIAEERLVNIGGVDQWIQLRGHDKDAPLLLFLHGGPGVIVSDIAYAYQRPWEDFFVVVNWDQRGFGRSWGQPEEQEQLLATLSKDQLIEDTIELIEYLCSQFSRQKVLLVGQSWGSVLTLEVAKRRPDLLFAACAQGLAANWMGSAEACRQKHIDLARQRGDQEEVARLEAVGPPPVDEGPDEILKWPIQLAVGVPDPHSWRNIHGPGDGWQRRIDGLRFISPHYSKEDYSALRQVEMDNPMVMRQRMEAMMCSILLWDAETDVGTEFSVPVVVMMGAFDLQTPIEPARQYYEKIKAPWKQWIEFPEAAHALNIEQPGLAVVSLVNSLLPTTRNEMPPGVDR